VEVIGAMSVKVLIEWMPRWPARLKKAAKKRLGALREEKQAYWQAIERGRRLRSTIYRSPRRNRLNVRLD
jgi:hypothetical protein